MIGSLAEDGLPLSALAVSRIGNVDECSGICACGREAQLLDATMYHIAALLLQAIGIDGQGIHIAMLNDQLGRLTGSGIP